MDNAPLPGLSVTGIGPIGLPLSDAQAKLVIKKSTQASKTDIHQPWTNMYYSKVILH